MVNINSVEGIESLIEKRTRPLKGQIRELQTELIKLKQALTIPVVVVPKGTLGCGCDSPYPRYLPAKEKTKCMNCRTEY
jgi:hypothetical protein